MVTRMCDTCAVLLRIWRLEATLGGRGWVRGMMRRGCGCGFRGLNLGIGCLCLMTCHERRVRGGGATDTVVCLLQLLLPLVFVKVIFSLEVFILFNDEVILVFNTVVAIIMSRNRRDCRTMCPSETGEVG